MEASRAGSVETCEILIEASADVDAVDYDGASPMALAILSHNEIATRLISKRMHSQNMFNLASCVQHMTRAFLKPTNIEGWLRDGISPLALKGEIGALLTSPSTEPTTKEQLRHVRAFLNHNEALLEKSPSEWPVTHTVLQLASQETGEVFADPHSALGDETSPAKRPPRLIHWLNKPNSHRCRLTMRARGEVRSVSYSKCGRKLARAEGNKVVVCDAETGFVESTLAVDSGEYGVWSVSFSPKDNVIAAGCYNGKIHLVDAVAGEVKSTLGVDGLVSSLNFSPCGSKIAAAFIVLNDIDEFKSGSVKIFGMVGSTGTFECESTLAGHSDW